MDSQLRYLQQQSRHGDPSALAQYWAALLRAGLLPIEYILALSRIGHPVATQIQQAPRNQGAKKYIGYLLTRRHIPERDIYDFSLLLIKLLADEWRLLPEEALSNFTDLAADSENHYHLNDQWQNALHYLSSLGPNKLPEQPHLEHLITRLTLELEASGGSLTDFITCDSSVELPLILICCKMLYEIGGNPLITLSQVTYVEYDPTDPAVPTFQQAAKGNLIEFDISGGLGPQISGNCLILAESFFLPWKKFLNKGVILPMNLKDPWLHLVIQQDGRRVKNQRPFKQAIEAMTNRFNSMVETFFLERIDNLTSQI